MTSRPLAASLSAGTAAAWRWPRRCRVRTQPRRRPAPGSPDQQQAETLDYDARLDRRG